MKKTNRTALAILILIAATFLLIGISTASERITQGSIVYLNETYDISGTVGWSTKLVWAGRWADTFSIDNSSIKYSLELPNSKQGYYHFYIDPEIFGNRLGWWYQYYNGYEEQGNLRAFYVKETRPEKNETENIAELGILTIKPTPKPTPDLPVRKEADYLVARGDPLEFRGNWTTPHSVWIFGRIDGIFDARTTTAVTTIDEETIGVMEPGSYTMLVIEPGQNGQIDCQYKDGEIKWIDISRFQVGTIETDGKSPMVLLDQARAAFKSTDDIISEYSLEIQEPYLEIVNRDTIYYNEDTVKMLVRGYTNEAPNKSVFLTIDRNANAPQVRHTLSVSAKIMDSGDYGTYRYFVANFTVKLNETSGYQHDIDAVSPLGATASADFFVYTAPTGSVVPNRTIKYIGGNEFIPTPTPEIVRETVTIVSPPEIRMEYVTVTPAIEQVRQADWDNKMKLVQEIGIIAVLITIAAYLISIPIRDFRKGRK